ncbi:hypothetical protein DOTSEDRAFT_114926, partial [Dothistroma septosporum NZE10]
ISLFVRNLRLLKFDLLQDWPAITAASLGNHDARTRIRCAEWALFHLFRVHDPATTTDKLQPFFPPLEPLQSINLRAALYRCLDGLKKGGVLGRETVLRKSMLDDCQGDKFWELCLAFSTIVLRKAMVDKKNRHPQGKPLAQRLGTAQGLSQSQRDSLLPMAIAHRAALAKVLSEKERKRQTYDTLFDVFVDKESDLHDRKVKAEQRRVRQPRAAIAEEVLEQDWVGSAEVRAALLNGDEAAGGDSLLTRPFAQVWAMNEKNRLFWSKAADVGVLEDLENRTRQQKQRLQRWHRFHDKLVQSKQLASKIATGASTSELRFDQHQNMTLRDMACDPRPPAPASRYHEKHDSVTKYDEILTAMREELRKTSAVEVPRSPKKKEPEATPWPRQHAYDARKRSIASMDSNDGANEQHPQRTRQDSTSSLAPGISASSTPTRNGSGTSTPQQDDATPNPDKTEVPKESNTSALIQQATLQERTRQSISLAPQPAPRVNKRASHARSRTSTFPVNQFETPPRRSTVSIAVAEETPVPHRDITPRDKLFEEDAEYASIFKPRPKVKLSPIVSP